MTSINKKGNISMYPQTSTARATHGIRLAAAIAVLFGPGCATTPDTGQDSDAIESLPSANSTRHINGTLLYAKTVGQEHAIEFYEFSPGAVAIHESLSMDSGEAAVIDSTRPFASLTAEYQKLNPGQTQVPAALVAADHRAAQLVASAAMPGVMPPAAGDGAKLNMAPSSASGTCSGDVLADNWGASWFLDNFCNAGGFRYCQTNFGWVDSGTFSRSWASWRQMEGDFNLPGHIRGFHWFCDRGPFGIAACGWQTSTDFEYDVLPRHVEVWNWNNGSSNAEVHGTSQCGHLHVAFLWN
jgi:hypothetical protein